MAFPWFGRAEQPAPAIETKASATGKVVALAASSGRVVWSPRDTVSLTRSGFVNNPVGFRAVRLIAEAAAVPLICQDREHRYETHPVLDLLRRPNPGQSRSELFETLFGQLLLSGNGYLEAVGDAGKGLPLELHVLRSDRMAAVPGPDGWPIAYEYGVGGRKFRFEMAGSPDPICHIRSFHPLDNHYGLSPMQAAVAVDVHNSASSWSKALLDNAARPSGAIIYRGADGQGSRDAGDMTGAGSSHDFTVSVLSGTEGAQGFGLVKEAAETVSAILDHPEVALSRGQLVSMWLLRARARRTEKGSGRRVDLTFRARIDLG